MENNADPAQNVTGGTASRSRVDTIKTGIGLLRGATVQSGFGVAHTECEETGKLWHQLISSLGIEGELSEALKNGIPTTREFQILLLRKLFGEHIVPLSVDKHQSENIKASTKMLYQRYNCSSNACGAKLVAAMFNEFARLQGNEKRITADQVVKGLVSFQNDQRVKGTGRTEEFPELIEERGIMIRSNFHSQQTPIFYSAKPSTVVPRNELPPVEDEAEKAELAAYPTPGFRLKFEEAAKNKTKADQEARLIGPLTPDPDLPRSNENTNAHRSLPLTKKGSVSGLSPPNLPGMDCEKDIPALKDEESASELQEAENAPDSIIGKVSEEPPLLDDEEGEYMDSEIPDEIKNLDPQNLEASVKVQLQTPSDPNREQESDSSADMLIDNQNEHVGQYSVQMATYNGSTIPGYVSNTVPCTFVEGKTCYIARAKQHSRL